MSRPSILILAVIVFVLSLAPLSAGADGGRASPEEVVQKVRRAADFLSRRKADGIAAFQDPDGEWVWKDTYVWVLQCSAGTNAAHAIKPKLVGMNLMGIRDTAGKLFFAEFCEMARHPNGGWVEYMWPKVGKRTPSRKITYILQVPGTDYEVAAGIYDDTADLAALRKLIE